MHLPLKTNHSGVLTYQTAFFEIVSTIVCSDLEPCNYCVIPFLGAEFGILKWNFHVHFHVYINVNYKNKM